MGMAQALGLPVSGANFGGATVSWDRLGWRWSAEGGR